MQNTVMNISSTVGKVQRAAVNDQSSLFSTLNKRKLGTRLPTGSFRSSSALSPASSKSNIDTLSGHQTTASTHPSIKAKKKRKEKKMYALKIFRQPNAPYVRANRSTSAVCQQYIHTIAAIYQHEQVAKRLHKPKWGIKVKQRGVKRRCWHCCLYSSAGFFTF